MLFGMLIAKRNDAIVVISVRSGRSGRGMVGIFAFPMRVLLDI